ncbi:MAG: cyclodeaminase/cyclohydrolase family protein [Candidatus Acidiferrales bacterium]|jgi:formiminotetrahydrofolate cyclodeaminase
MMSGSVWQETLDEFVAQLGSAKPTPGGGAVAALSACLAASLLEMVLQITARAHPSAEARLAVVQTQLIELRRSVDQDIESFNRFLDARRMPQLTEVEQTRRKDLQRSALQRCTEVPLAAAQSALKLVPIARDLVGLAPAKVLSDVGVALAQLDSGLLGLLLNVNINLQGTASDPAFQQMHAQRDGLAGEVVSARQELATAIDLITRKITES